ncbi:UNVERIFIED_CONTAM: four helix bundle suffix domain-containing protein [Prevotella sp. 15_C9]
MMRREPMAQHNEKILKDSIPPEGLFCYQKANAAFELTFRFCKRFLPLYGDRTVDQMNQAARSGKQNIVEGMADGMTSTKTQLKLLNVARASLKELCEDYTDYLHTRQLTLWDKHHPRYDKMLRYCRAHNKAEDYMGFADKWTAEEFCNTLVTLCHFTDKMLCNLLDVLQRQFIEQGGITERMYAARTGYRKQQDELMKKLQTENAQLKAENAQLKAENERLKAMVKNNKQL